MTTLPTQLREIGIELVLNNSTLQCDCPFHTGASQTNTVTLRMDKDGWFYKCFACGANGRDVQDWIMVKKKEQ